MQVQDTEVLCDGRPINEARGAEVDTQSSNEEQRGRRITSPKRVNAEDLIVQRGRSHEKTRTI